MNRETPDNAPQDNAPHDAAHGDAPRSHAPHSHAPHGDASQDAAHGDASTVIWATVTDDVLDVAAHEAAVSWSWSGAVVGFTGVVRDHDRGRSVATLFYEAHPNAPAVMADIAARIAAQFPDTRIAVTHRVGHLTVGDVALAAAVASAHRGEAFGACAALVEEIKSSLPVWKRQEFTNGTDEWVGSL